MSDFDIAVSLVLKQEGGLSNNPDDHGGETKYGIAKRFHPDVDFSTLTPAGAKDIYRSDYWIEEWSALPQQLTNLLLSLSVNMGKAMAVLMVQKATGVVKDGSWGHLTQGAALSTPDVVVEVAAVAIQYYLDLNQPEFQRGWIRRVLEAVCTT